MTTQFLTLVRMSLGLTFNFTQWQALLTDLHRHSTHSESSPISQTTIKPSPIIETTIDPCLESCSLNSPSLRDSESSDVDKKHVNPHPQSSEKNPSLSQSATRARSSEDTENILRGGEQLNTSESPNIVSNNGKTSLVFEDRLIEEQHILIKYRRKKESLQRKMDHIEFKQIYSTKIHIMRLEMLKDDTDSEEKAAQIEMDLEHQKQKLHDACERRDKLQGHLDLANSIYQSKVERTQDLFEELLESLGLLNLPEEDNDSSSGIQETAGSDHTSASSIHSASTLPSMSELFRRGVSEELDKRRRIFYEKEDLFNERYRDLAKGLAEYHQDVQAGLCDMARSEFDRIALNAFQLRTRNLIDAEAFFEEVKSRARALGLLGNAWEQESNFVDEDYDGYRESYEASVTDGVNRDAIEAWSEDVLESDDVKIPGSAETDEWDAQSLDIGDSISCVDITRNGARIDRWREKCAAMKCEDTSSESHDCEIVLVKSHDSGYGECQDEQGLESKQ